jgi:hypothetical protein
MTIIRIMIKRLPLASGFLFMVLFSQAQFDTSYIKTNIRRCADSLTHGFKTKNWDLFTRYSYPAMVGSVGGKKEFAAYMASSFSSVPDSAWKKYEPGKVLQVLKTGKELLAVIELNSVLEWREMQVTSTDLLIAESWDGGLFWTFFDSQGDTESARRVKPDLTELLVIPPRKETILPLTGPAKPKVDQ